MEIRSFITIRSIFIFLGFIFSSGNSEEPFINVWTTVGDRVSMPCPLTPSLEGDRTVLVLWLKDVETVYSYDARGEDFGSGQRWYDKDVFGQRSFFTLTTHPPSLILDPVQESDQGEYTCRVEYLSSTSTFNKINLSVIVPPKSPVLLWDDKEVFGPIGPLALGQKVQLICQTKGGRPTPWVTWSKKGEQLKSVTVAKIVSNTTVVRAALTLEASRDLHQVPILCHAQAPNPNEALTQPKTASTFLNIILPPLTVKVTGLDSPKVAGTTLQPVCLSSGSNPLADIRWFLDDREIQETSTSVLNGGNVTSSSVTLHISSENHGSIIKCIATNSAMTGNQKEGNTLMDSVTLQILYPPKVELLLGRMLNASNLVEAKDAFLECQIRANPPPHRIEWYHNGQSVGTARGIVVSGGSLAMQHLTRDHMGSYQCSAENLEGKSFSNFIEIRIKHAPVCASRKERTQGAAIKQRVSVLCKVEADPADNLTFSWSRILPSGREIQLGDDAVTIKGVVSYLNMTIRHLGDFGQFLCKATNKVGTQRSPCKVMIVSAGPPETPGNCTITPGSEMLIVNCREGFHGGFPQTFLLEGWLKGNLISNMTRKFPSWTIKGLHDGAELKIRIRAANAKGTSDAVLIDAHMPTAHQQSVTDPAELPEDGLGVLLGSIFGILAIVIIIFVAAILTVCRRKRLKRVKRSSQHLSTDGLQTSGGDVSPDVVSSIQYRSSSSTGLNVLSTRSDSLSRSKEIVSTIDRNRREAYSEKKTSSPELPNNDNQLSREGNESDYSSYENLVDDKTCAATYRKGTPRTHRRHILSGSNRYVVDSELNSVIDSDSVILGSVSDRECLRRDTKPIKDISKQSYLALNKASSTPKKVRYFDAECSDSEDSKEDLLNAVSRSSDYRESTV